MKSDTIPTRIWKIFAPLFLYLFISVLISIIYMSLNSKLMMDIVNASSQASLDAATKAYTDQINKDGLWLTGVMSIVCLPFLISIFKKDSRRLAPCEVEKNPLQYALLAVLGVSSAVSLNFIIALTGVGAMLEDTYQESAEIIYTAPLWIQLSVGAVLGPILEELIFRGIIYRRLRTYSIVPLAVLVSAIIFGVYHMNILQFIYAGILGMILAYVYEKYRSIVASIIVHVCGNAFAIVLSNNAGVENLMGGSDDRVKITTIISTIVMVICLVLVCKIRNNNTEMYEEV